MQTRRKIWFPAGFMIVHKETTEKLSILPEIPNDQIRLIKCKNDQRKVNKVILY
jgi:hypothetical protein